MISAARLAFLDAARTAADTVQTDEVAAAWWEPSALSQWTVGGIAGHAYLACRIARRSLDAPLPVGLAVESPSAGGLSRMRIDLASELEAENHRTIRGDGEHVARRGPAAVAAKFRDLIAALESRLEVEPADRRVPAPSGEVAYLLDDWLESRTIEMLVHADDLAVSVGLPPLVLPDAAAAVAIHGLVDIARHRVGDLAVLRALSRGERQSADTLRAF